MKPEKDPLATTILNLPVFEIPQLENVGGKMTWDQVTEETEPQRQLYLARYDSDEKRLREKNPLPFRMP
jgi:hypothetical protein